jgi:hypothetical protein
MSAIAGLSVRQRTVTDRCAQFFFQPHFEKMAAQAGECSNSTNFGACGLSLSRLVITTPVSR